MKRILLGLMAIAITSSLEIMLSTTALGQTPLEPQPADPTWSIPLSVYSLNVSSIGH
ncbi:MAG: hypothetical protein F6K30_16115 [Cyanothece sp. SIO2G6]|nr:hypothetical protein [Cyanothece sp. SIO2G6]